MNESEKTYNLEKRTSDFAKNVVLFCRGIKQNPVTNPLINQLVRAGTSIGANYMEANGASSRKDFKNKIHICKKEVQETRYWLKILQDSMPEKETQIEELWKEAQEFSMIFGKIVGTMNDKDSKIKLAR